MKKTIKAIYLLQQILSRYIVEEKYSLTEQEMEDAIEWAEIIMEIGYYDLHELEAHVENQLKRLDSITGLEALQKLFMDEESTSEKPQNK